MNDLPGKGREGWWQRPGQADALGMDILACELDENLTFFALDFCRTFLAGPLARVEGGDGKEGKPTPEPHSVPHTPNPQAKPTSQNNHQPHSNLMDAPSSVSTTAPKHLPHLVPPLGPHETANQLPWQSPPVSTQPSSYWTCSTTVHQPMARHLHGPLMSGLPENLASASPPVVFAKRTSQGTGQCSCRIR